jgi:hypothetical protein
MSGTNPIQGIDWKNKLNAQVNAVLKIAEFTFDAAGYDTAGVANTTVAAHPTPVELPAHAIIVGGFFDVNTVFTGVGASIALHVETANDIQTAAAISGAPWSSIGRKAIVPKANTPESTSIKTTQSRKVTATVSGAVLTAGKLTGYLYYIEGIASA